jgi:hypothetical protein
MAAALVIGAGFALAAISPQDGFLDLQGAAAAETAEEGLRQAWASSQATLDADGGELSLRLLPATFVLIPLLACLVAGLAFARLTRGAAGGARLAWGAALGVPFALAMLILAALAGEIPGDASASALEPQLGQVAGLSLLWGALGGAAGAGLALRRDRQRAPAPVGAAAAVLWAAWRPLLWALALATVIGTSAVIVQTMRDAGDVRTSTGRSPALAAGETAAYALDHGVHFIELGGAAEFREPGLYGILGMPLPVTDYTAVAAEPNLDPRSVGGYRIFDYEPALPAWAYAGLLAVIILPVVFAVNAGARVARVREAGSAALGALWGLLVGPLWALAMVALAVLVQKQLYGEVWVDSVLLSFLAGGAVCGALGGAVAGWRNRRRAPTPA